MNKAQKRTWVRLLICVVTLLVAATLIVYFRRTGIDIYDFSTPERIRRYVLLGILSAVPLILIALVDRGWKKVYDERDLQIERRAAVLSAIGAFTFLAGAGWFLTVDTKMGSIKAVLVMLLVCSVYFVWNPVLRTVVLIQYGRGGNDNE